MSSPPSPLARVGDRPAQLLNRFVVEDRSRASEPGNTGQRAGSSRQGDLERSSRKGSVAQQRMKQMRRSLISAALAISLLPVAANAQLTINMNQIKCDQYLAMSPDMSRDFSAWMSGWFSYQTRRTFVDLSLHQKNIANVKAWCQYHPQESVMTGLQNAIKPE
jgi:HdeA/HdeB family